MPALSSRAALIIFMRYPEPGKVKRRLAVSIGAEEAARVYEALVRRTVGIAADFKQLRPKVDLFLAFTPLEKESLARERFNGPWDFFLQEGSHLGERMENAIRRVFHLGYGSVLLTGTDLVDTEASDFASAFDATSRGYGVLGPAADGGFYLIGLNRPCREALRPDQWGAGEICLRTEELLRKEGFAVVRTATRRDIDRPEDMSLFRSHPFLDRSLSVIIPTLSGAEQLGPLLHRLQAGLWPRDEIMVVRGMHHSEKSSPSPHDPVSRLRWLYAPMGRGLQLDLGARAARGDILLFLHDDSLPPLHFAYAVRKICQAPSSSLGCFSLSFSPSNRGLDWIAAGANLRARIFGLPYGDQGLHCRRETFEEAGGFKRPYLMEDVDFVRSCRRCGALMILPDRIVTSPKRYMTRGLIRTWLQNQLLMLLYSLGVNDEDLYRLYYRRRP